MSKKKKAKSTNIAVNAGSPVTAHPFQSERTSPAKPLYEAWENITDYG